MCGSQTETPRREFWHQNANQTQHQFKVKSRENVGEVKVALCTDEVFNSDTSRHRKDNVCGWMGLSALFNQKLLSLFRRPDLIPPDVHIGELLSSKLNITRCCSRKNQAKSSEVWFTLTGQRYQCQPRIHEELNTYTRRWVGWIVPLFYSGLNSVKSGWAERALVLLLENRFCY